MSKVHSAPRGDPGEWHLRCRRSRARPGPLPTACAGLPWLRHSCREDLLHEATVVKPVFRKRCCTWPSPQHKATALRTSCTYLQTMYILADERTLSKGAVAPWRRRVRRGRQHADERGAVCRRTAMVAAWSGRAAPCREFPVCQTLRDASSNGDHFLQKCKRDARPVQAAHTA